MTQNVLFTVANSIATITLNRPSTLNSIDEEMAQEWTRAAQEAVSRSEVSAIVLQSSGRAFCAGGDVRAMSEMVDPSTGITALAHRINDGISSLVHSSKPVVAAAQGATAGGGLGILLASDYAVIGKRSKIGSLYANVGLSPDLSVSALLARAIGERRALQLTLREQLLSSTEAIEWGLAAEAVADADVQTRALEIATHWVSNGPEAYGEAKRLIRSQPTRTFTQQLSEEAQTIGRLAATDHAAAKISAFAAR